MNRALSESMKKICIAIVLLVGCGTNETAPLGWGMSGKGEDGVATANNTLVTLYLLRGDNLEKQPFVFEPAAPNDRYLGHVYSKEGFQNKTRCVEAKESYCAFTHSVGWVTLGWVPPISPIEKIENNVNGIHVTEKRSGAPHRLVGEYNTKTHKLFRVESLKSIPLELSVLLDVSNIPCSDDQTRMRILQEEPFCPIAYVTGSANRGNPTNAMMENAAAALFVFSTKDQPWQKLSSCQWSPGCSAGPSS